MSTNDTPPATTQAHTPGPWHIDRQSPHSPMCIKPYPGRIVCEIDGTDAEAEANAAFIVRACNAHEAMRKASQDLYDRLREYLDVSDGQLIEQGYDGLVKAMDDIEAAWHEADGTQPERHEIAA